MDYIKAIKEKKHEEIIELYGLYSEEFKTKLKTFTDVEKMIDAYTTIYVYFAPRKQVLQILGNYKEDRIQKDEHGEIKIDEDDNPIIKTVYTKTIIYNYKKRQHKGIDELGFSEIYAQLLEFCSVAEQLIMIKNFEREEEEIIALQALSSEKIDREKIREFLKE